MSNVVEFEARAVVERQAREWLIRLDGDEPLSAAEEARLRQWIDLGPAHKEELLRIARFWGHANILTELAVPRASRRVPLSWRGAHFAALAASLAAISIGFFIWRAQTHPSAANGIYATAIGKQESIDLPDGSSVQLNTDSQVQVDYSKARRRIRLLRGEALFSVVRDASRPFDVHAGDGLVRALGTAFSVHLKGRQLDVTVTKGVVEVAAHAQSLGVLRAGEATALDLVVPQMQVQQLPEPELERRLSWHEGYLVFSGEPLSEVVVELNRYSPVTVEIADPSLAQLAIGGRFRVGDLDAVLDVLHESFGIESTRVDDRYIRLRPEPSR